jgi:hypothetical protein
MFPNSAAVHSHLVELLIESGRVECWFGYTFEAVIVSEERLSSPGFLPKLDSRAGQVEEAARLSRRDNYRAQMVQEWGSVSRQRNVHTIG